MEKQNQTSAIESTELANVEVKTIAFKSPELTAATERIAIAFSTTVKARRDACVEFARIERNQLYKSDGLKSLAEYAERIGIKKSLAHKMENAGRLMISDNETIKEFAAKTDYSKLSKLASVDETVLVSAIDSGEIKPESTQEQVDDWKQAKKDAKTVKILKRYDIRFTQITAVTDPVADTFKLDGRNFTYINTALEELEEISRYKWARVKVDEKRTVSVGINPITGALALYNLAPATKPTLKDRASDNLREKLAAMSPEELAALLASISAKAE